MRMIMETGEHGGLGGGADSKNLETASRGSLPPLGEEWRQAELSVMRIAEGIGLVARLDGKETLRAIDRDSTLHEFHYALIATTFPNTNGLEVANVRWTLDFEDAREQLVDAKASLFEAQHLAGNRVQGPAPAKAHAVRGHGQDRRSGNGREHHGGQTECEVEIEGHTDS